MGNKHYEFAAASLGLPALANGNIYFVDVANGAVGNDGASPQTAINSIEEAYARTTANQHDIVAYIAGASGNNLAAKMTWANSYTHLIGVCAPTGIAQRARIFMTSTVITTPMMTISGTGCIFKNIYMFHGIGNAAALIGTEVTGGRCYFKNVHFAGIGHATQGDQAGARSLKLTGAEECLFEDCTIGVDTIARSTTNAEIELSTSATRNVFRNCLILAYADNAGHLFIKAGATSIDRFALFENCLFSNPIKSAATLMTEAIDGNASAGGAIILRKCTLFGATDWEGTQTITYIDGAAPTGNTSGLAVVVA